MGIYEINSARQENFLAEHGIYPIAYYKDGTAVYRYNERLQSVLDYYWITYKIFRK